MLLRKNVRNKVRIIKRFNRGRKKDRKNREEGKGKKKERNML